MCLSELDFLCTVAIASNLILFLLLATNAVLILPFLFIASLVFSGISIPNGIFFVTWFTILVRILLEGGSSPY